MKTKLFLLFLVISVNCIAKGTLSWDLHLSYKLADKDGIVITEFDALKQEIDTLTLKTYSTSSGSCDLFEPTFLLFITKELSTDKNRYYVIPAMPGEKVIITDKNDGRYDINGSDFYEKIHEVDTYIEGLQRKSKDIYNQFAEYVKANPNSEACAMMIPIALLNDKEKIKSAAQLLSPELSIGRLKKYVDRLINADNILYNIGVFSNLNVQDNYDIKIFDVSYRGKRKSPTFTTPEKAGYTLLYTKTMKGYKSDFYLEGVHTDKYDNGDFVTIQDSNSSSLGDWQVTSENGIVMKYENGVVRVYCPSGIIIEKRSKDNRDVSFPWKVKDKRPFSLTWYTGDLLYLPNDSTPSKYVDIRTNAKGYGPFKTKGYLKEDRLYTVTEDGVAIPFKQIIKNCVIGANANDTISDVKLNNMHSDDATLEIKYKNGDYLNCDYSLTAGDYIIKSGSIHRNGGILTIKEVNGDVVKLLSFPNGDKYVGDFYYEFRNYEAEGGFAGASTEKFKISDLSFPELQFWNGTLIKANGKRIDYKKGKSEQQLAAEKKAAEAKAMAQYNTLCKRFGKKYVDAALNQYPIVGMPEELLKSAFTLRFEKQSGDYKLYRITGLGWKNFGRTLTDNATLYSIWVRNGRVVDVRYWGN